MGDIIEFKPKEPKPPINNLSLDFPKFLEFYKENIDLVNSLTNFLILSMGREIDIEQPTEYDVFILREAAMSLAMRSAGIYHPLQDLTDEYVKIFSPEPDNDQ